MADVIIHFSLDSNLYFGIIFIQVCFSNFACFGSLHKIRNILDLKAVYTAPDEQSALFSLDAFEQKWGGKYPKTAVSWRNNRANLSTYFKYPKQVRTLIYTANSIEGFNRQLRKVTENKGVFPTHDSLFKMLYLAMMDITNKWTGRRRDWGQIHSQRQFFFAVTLPR